MRRRRTPIALSLALIAIAILVAACGSDDGGESASLEGTAWVLESGEAPLDAPGDAPPTATFEDGALSGFGGCNQYNGGYELDGDAITFGPIASTQMACPEPQMAVEAAYFAALASVSTWSVDGQTLVLSGEEGELLSYATGE